jgi:hypothetical protein
MLQVREPVEITEEDAAEARVLWTRVPRQTGEDDMLFVSGVYTLAGREIAFSLADDYLISEDLMVDADYEHYTVEGLRVPAALMERVEESIRSSLLQTLQLAREASAAAWTAVWEGQGR